MTPLLLKYALSNGYIQNWLVAGPMTIPVPDCLPDSAENRELTIVRQYSDPDSGVTEAPVELGPLDPGLVSQDDQQITWQYYHCREDHYIDFTAFHPTCVYLRAWAYAKVVASSGQEVSLCLTTNGPADVWLNGQHIQRWEHFNKQSPVSISFSAALNAGANDLLIRFENAGLRETPFVTAVQILSLTDGVEINLPTGVDPEFYNHRVALEQIADKAWLDRYIYGYLDGDHVTKNEPIPLHFSAALDLSGELTVRLQSLQGDIFQEGTKVFIPGEEVKMAFTYPLRNGPHHLAIRPPHGTYYLKNVRFERKDLFHVVRTPFSVKVFPKLAARKREALEDAAGRRNNNLFCEIARMALDQWETIERKNLTQAIDRITRHADGSAIDVLGFISILFRFRKKPAYRKYFRDINPILQASLLDYRYWTDASGKDCMDFASESRQILYHTCEILAGQLLSEQTFKATGMTGKWHKEHGESLAIAWLRQRGQFGFAEWDSPVSLETILAALSHLVDLAESETVSELASVLMDKIFFGLAVNSFDGCYGSSRGHADTASVLSARLEATSGISRILWGLGNLNEAVMGAVSLAYCKNYALPELIGLIAWDHPGAIWNREQHSLPSSGEAGSLWSVNKVSYRTGDYLLSSAQDYKPGQPGNREHVWQATLGPDAVVFTNHPTCLSEDDSHSPNLWAGNGILPRAAQWGDVLISIYNFPQDDWLGFTHAYFPAVVFDEFSIYDHWAFAKRGNAYLALGAKNKLEFITSGPTAFRELRSLGNENIWICQMGQAILDGSFEDFQNKVLGLELAYHGLNVQFQSLRNEQVSFGWESPFMVKGEERSLSGFRHIENMYCAANLPASSLEIIYKDMGVRLKFD